MIIKRIDHVVLTVSSITKTIQFYTKILGMVEITFGDNRKALVCGQQKINLHEAGNEFEPKAFKPTAGSMDICFETEILIDEIIDHLAKNDIGIVEGPTRKTGAKGDMLSIYLRDPDQNLIEISNYSQKS